MKFAAFGFVILLAAHAGAEAQTRCSMGSLGTTTCRHSDETTTRATTDSSETPRVNTAMG